MKQANIIISALLGSLIVWQLGAFAEMIEGEVMGIDLQLRTMRIHPINSKTNQAEELEIAILESNDGNLFSQLRTGDQVKINMFQKNRSGVWEAEILEILIRDDHDELKAPANLETKGNQTREQKPLTEEGNYVPQIKLEF